MKWKKGSREVWLERDLVAGIKKWCEECGVYYIRNVGGVYNRSGIPDFVICYNGLFIGIECKRYGGKLTKAQSRELSRIVNSGGRSFVISDVEQFKRVMDGVSRSMLRRGGYGLSDDWVDEV